MDNPNTTTHHQRRVPSLTTDVALVAADVSGRRHILLIRRKNPPFQGCWALPGGFLEYEERVLTGAVRELGEETGVHLSEDRLRFLAIADDPDRDCRTRVISLVFLAEGSMEEFHPHAADDASEVCWFLLDAPPPLAFDHAWLISEARRAIQA